MDPQAPPPLVETRALSRRFGAQTAVDGLDLRVEPGEIFGLVGPDGAGKTTVLRLLAAVMRPSTGQARVLGHDSVREAEAIHARTGYMAQRFNLYPDLTVAENLDFFADVFGVSGAARVARIERLLGFAGLGDLRGRRAGQLSGGMQKKLALATTLVHQPELLLLDEPTTGVDPVSRREFWEILTDLHLDGIGILVSTPYMDEAERCSRVCLLYAGRPLVVDRPEALRDLPAGELLELRSERLAEARHLLEGLPGLREVQTYGDRLHLFVDQAAAGRARVETALAAAGIPVLSLEETRPRLEEAFISLIRAQERAEAAGEAAGEAEAAHEG